MEQINHCIRMNKSSLKLTSLARKCLALRKVNAIREENTTHNETMEALNDISSIITRPGLRLGPGVASYVQQRLIPRCIAEEQAKHSKAKRQRVKW